MKHYNITIRGKVQGVYFRQSCKQMAGLLSVKGFVQNEPNGDVYAEAEGEEDLLIKFIQWCHHGPENAEVKHVSVSEGELKNFQLFELRR